MISQVESFSHSFRRFAGCQLCPIAIFWDVRSVWAWHAICDTPYNKLPEPHSKLFSQTQIFVLKFDLFVNLFVMNFPFASLRALLKSLREMPASSGSSLVGRRLIARPWWRLCLAFGFSCIICSANSVGLKTNKFYSHQNSYTLII